MQNCRIRLPIDQCPHKCSERPEHRMPFYNVSLGVEHTEQAIEIVNWHLQEARRILASPPENSIQQEAKKLMKWMLTSGLQQTTPRFIQQSGPFRYKTQRDTALEILAENHWIRMDKKDNQVMTEVNPHAVNAWD